MPELPKVIEYNDTDVCLFQTKLQNFGSGLVSGLQIAVIGGDISIQRSFFRNLQSFLERQSNYNLCLKEGVDIRDRVMKDFGNVDEIFVVELLVVMDICGMTSQPAHTTVFGRSARLLFNNSVTSE